MTRQVSVVPHTHWDREWYAPFQTFRARLVELLDELLPRLEGDPSYAHFMLDGQMAVVDDHLALRPGDEAVLRRLATSGRLAMGPWYVLMDEFLVSGETIVRNLQKGRARAAEFGGAMEVGYLPDMFGHIAQMPQILHQFGLRHAVVWRGTPSEIDRTGFWWRAPDGSTVRAEYLPQGYGNGAVLPDDSGDLVARVAEFDATHRELIGDGTVLWMNGTDHQVPFASLGRVVARANEEQKDYELVVRSLAEHVATAATDGLPTWDGELRSGARANLLMGVASNRVDVKQAAARAERSLERVAEPFAALLDRHAIVPWPTAMLDMAWHDVVLNSAHDSICACSADEVVDAVMVRFSEATQIAEAIVDRGLRALGAAVGGGRVAVVNTLARPRAGLVELDLPGDGTDDDGLVQTLATTPARAHVHTVTRADAPTVVERELDIHLGAQRVDVAPADDGVLDVTIVVDPTDRRVPAFGAAIRRLRELAHEPGRAADPVRVWVDQPPSRRVLTRTPPIPGLAWRTWDDDAVEHVAPVRIDDDGTLANGVITVSVDALDGTFGIDGHVGLGRLVDDGDEGDTYNFSPPASQSVVDAPEEVEVEIVEEGPLRAQVAIVARYRWPSEIVDGERVGQEEVEVRTTLELRAGEAFVRVTTTLDNECRDHRLRAWLPLPEPSNRSEAECAFGTVERGLVAEGGETEVGLPTFPSRRFVRAGGLTVAHEGLLEYELVDIEGDGRSARARSLALTMLRATGWLSRGPMTYRPLPAGPVIETPDAQVIGRHELRWAVSTADIDPYEMVDEAFVPLLVARDVAHRPATAPDAAQLLDVSGAEVSAVLAEGGRPRVRLFNPSAEPATVELGGRRGWLEDLAGRPIEPVDGSFELPPRRIATLALD